MWYTRPSAILRFRLSITALVRTGAAISRRVSSTALSRIGVFCSMSRFRSTRGPPRLTSCPDSFRTLSTSPLTAVMASGCFMRLSITALVRTGAAISRRVSSTALSRIGVFCSMSRFRSTRGPPRLTSCPDSFRTLSTSPLTAVMASGCFM
ncbi:hypothetical protein CRUP_008901, partial [Coryphaenoides rupestris]